MKPPAFDYAAPATLEAALALLNANLDGAKLLAGGQSLVPVLNLRLASPSLLIDLNRIAGLSGLTRDPGGALVAGAMTRHRTFELSELVRQTHPLLGHAMSHVAHVQIRNRGTIGGSLSHADPAAEWPALCVACEAQMTVACTGSTRVVPAEDFSLGVYATALAASEMLVGIRFPAWPAGREWGFQELSRRRGDFALVGAVALLDFDPDKTCTRARVVVFGASDAPVVVSAAGALVGRRAEPKAIAGVAKAARAQVATRSDHHASAQYRSELVEVLARRALNQATGIPQRATT